MDADRDPLDRLAPEVLEALRYYTARYDTLVHEALQPEGGKRFLGVKPQRCRFCGRTRPEVRFQSDAHAISAVLGNRTLFTLEECHHCNQRFSEFEDDLAKWTMAERSFGQVRGRKRVPSLKTRSGRSRADLEDTAYVVTQIEGDEILSYDPRSGKAQGRYTPQPYRPRGVYKALLKMALTVMPAAELGNFQRALKWLLAPGLEQDAVSDGLGFLCFKSFTSGPLPYPYPIIALYRRKPGVKDCPYASFLISYGNTTLQIFLPSERDQDVVGNELKIVSHPAPASLDPQPPYEHSTVGTVKLASPELVQDEPQTFTFHVGRAIRRDLTGEDSK
jgi:hypothetical protein